MESLLVGKQSRAYCPPIFRCFSILFLFSALRCAVVLPTATTVSGDMAGERTVTTKLVDLGRSDAPEPTMPGSVRVPEERLESARSSRLSPGTRSRIHSSSRTHGRPYRKPGMIAVALLGVILAVLYAKRPSPAAAEKVVQLTERWIEKPWRPLLLLVTLATLLFVVHLSTQPEPPKPSADVDASLTTERPSFAYSVAHSVASAGQLIDDNPRTSAALMVAAALILRLILRREEKPEEKPEEKREEKPEEKREEKPEEKREEKPEEKREEKPEEKREEKPEEKREEKPEEKREEKPEEKLILREFEDD